MYVLISERWGKDRTCINYDKLIQDSTWERNDKCVD